MEIIKCPYCGKESNKFGIKSHIYSIHGEGKNKKHNGNKGHTAWNKGLTKETDERIKKYSETYSQKIKTGELKPSWKGKHHSKETIEKLKQNSGGYRKGSGRGKHGWYKGYWCDSSWELAFVIYNLEHNIKFERNVQKFKYIYNNEEHHYIPDFIMEDGTYIEIKGYETEKDKVKYNNFQYNFKLLKFEDLTEIFEYVKNKYGEDFIKLYDNFNKNILKNKIKEQQKNLKIEKKNQEIEYKKQLILSSNIDFSKIGWVKQVSNIINIGSSKVNKWMKKNMLDFYNEKCFKKSNNR